MTCTSYCKKIEEIFDAIIRLASEVLPENRKEVDKYISEVWGFVTVWMRSIKREEGTEELRAKFESHVLAEEARLHRNFEGILYDIDSYDTVRLVAGNGRAETVIIQTPFLCFNTLISEQFLFPMFYLALKRDLERISLARKHVLSHFELHDTMETIVYIGHVGQDRSMDLESETKTPPRSRFHLTKASSHLSTTESRSQGTAQALCEGHGECPHRPIHVASTNLSQYQLYNESGAALNRNQLRELPDPIPARDEIIPDPDSIPLAVLIHPLGTKHEIPLDAYEEQLPVLPSEEGPV